MSPIIEGTPASSPGHQAALRSGFAWVYLSLLLSSCINNPVPVAVVPKRGVKSSEPVLAALPATTFNRADTSEQISLEMSEKTNDGVVNVKAYGAKGDGSTDDSMALLAAFEATVTTGKTLYFPEGTYLSSAPLVATSKDNFRISGARGALLKKASNFPDEKGLLILRFCNNVVIEGLRFQGLTTSTTGFDWGDNGVMAFSCNNLAIKGNHFKDFGDAAFQVGTYTYVNNPPTAVDHSTTFITENVFENVQQTSTTPGGTESIVFSSNVAESLKGSFKFASRLVGAGSLIVSNNVVRSSLGAGVEIVSYSNAVVVDNIISNCESYGVSIYTNANADVAPSFPWKNVKVNGNLISNCRGGVRVSNDAYSDRKYYLAEGIEITKNTIDTTTGTGATGGILLLNGVYKNARIEGNTVRRSSGYGILVSTRGIKSLADVDNLVIDNNIIDDTPNMMGLSVERIASDSDRTLKQVFARNNVLNNVAGTSLSGIDQLHVEGNHFATSASVVLSAVSNVFVKRNYLKSSASGLNLDATVAAVEGNHLEGASGFGLRISPTSSGVAVQNNTVVGGAIQNVQPVNEGALNWNPVSLANGAGETSPAIAVADAKLGDFVMLSAPYDLQGLNCNAYVSAANTVKIRIQNNTGATVDLGSGIWKVRVMR